jgi:hypothetical protein
MIRPSSFLALLGVCLSAACVHTNEMPLAPNVVRLDTRASGLLFQGQAAPQTMRRAAELTLKGGFSHFRLSDASTGQGTVSTGGMINVVPTGYGGGFATYTPTYAPIEGVGVTVTMYHANEPGAQGAFDAEAVLKQYQQ